MRIFMSRPILPRPTAALAYRSGRDRPPGRRHLRAVPLTSARPRRRRSERAPRDRAVRGVVGSILGMLEVGATHLGVATDHVIESFRNGLVRLQDRRRDRPASARAVPAAGGRARALGVVVWPMVEFEADDALAAAAADGRGLPGRARDHLHARQGSRPVRARHARRESIGGARCGRGGCRREVRRARRPRFPITSRSSATRPTASPAARVGAASAAAVLARYVHLEPIPPTGRGLGRGGRGAGGWPRRSTSTRARPGSSARS